MKTYLNNKNKIIIHGPKVNSAKAAKELAGPSGCSFFTDVLDHVRGPQCAH